MRDMKYIYLRDIIELALCKFFVYFFSLRRYSFSANSTFLNFFAMIIDLIISSGKV